MKQDEEQKQGAAGEAAAKRRGWSEDPLSVFLLVGAVVLGLMYGLESRQRSGLERQEVAARKVAARAGFGEDACRIGAAGAGGEVLVVSCPGVSVEGIVARLGGALDGTQEKVRFERVYVGGQNGAGEHESRACALRRAGKEGVVLEVQTCRVLEGRKQGASGEARGIAKLDAGDFGEIGRRLGV